VVGNIAVQAAKLLGAGRVVAAGRNPDALEKLRDLGADDIVRLGGDDSRALQDAAGDGFDVVIDPIYGDPFLAALSATKVGAILITIGQSAGPAVGVPFRALMGRTHVGHGNNVMPPDVLRQGYQEITQQAADGRIRVETTRYSLDEAEKAWEAQAHGPHVKIAIQPTPLSAKR
jgi:NADPH2:quinone reductase